MGGSVLAAFIGVGGLVLGNTLYFAVRFGALEQRLTDIDQKGTAASLAATAAQSAALAAAMAQVEAVHSREALSLDVGAIARQLSALEKRLGGES